MIRRTQCLVDDVAASFTTNTPVIQYVFDTAVPLYQYIMSIN